MILISAAHSFLHSLHLYLFSVACMSGYLGVVAKESQKQSAFSVWQTWISAGFCASFIVSTFFSVTVNLWCLFGVLVVAAPLYIFTDVASTSETKDFCKRVLRAVCCYSGLYAVSEPTANKGALTENGGRKEQPPLHGVCEYVFSGCASGSTRVCTLVK